MTNSDWLWKGIFFCLCIIHQFNIGIDGHHNGKCLTPDNRQGVCVVKRYCREASSQPLATCEDDDRLCCPIPITQRTSNPPLQATKSPGVAEAPARSPSENERHKIQPSVGNRQPSTADERSRKPISFNKPAEELPSIRPSRPRNQPEADGNSPRLIQEDRRSRKPVSSYGDSAEELPPNRQSDSGRTRKNPTVGDFPPINEGERSRKPASSYDIPVEDPSSRHQKDRDRSVGRPKYDESLDRLPNKSISTGRVRFEDEPSRSFEDRPVKQSESDRPSGIAPVDKDDRRPEYSSESRKEIPSFSKPRGGSDDSKSSTKPRDDEYGRDIRRRPQIEKPRHYPSEDEIKVHRNPSIRPKPSTRNQGSDGAKSSIEFPGPYELSVPQPKVPACGVKPYELFIAGGETSEAHEWPWMTAIFRRHLSSRPKTFLCGGSLINTKYVLTAAHCFVNNYVILPASSFIVRLGSHNLNSGEEYTVSNLVIHHNHSGSDFFNDIALVRLASEVYITDKIAPICLPFPDMVNDNLVDKMATVAGWGDTSFRTGGTRDLQHVTVPIVSSEECFAAYSRVRGAAFLARGSDHVVCAGLREGGKDACLGDSGGPLMMKASEDRWIIVGIVSLGYKCAEPGYPGVYTRVTHYMSWIHTNMKRH